MEGIRSLLRDWRKRAGLTQPILARKAGLSESVYQRIERGVRTKELDASELHSIVTAIRKELEELGQRALAEEMASEILGAYSGGASVRPFKLEKAAVEAFVGKLEELRAAIAQAPDDLRSKLADALTSVYGGRPRTAPCGRGEAASIQRQIRLLYLLDSLVPGEWGESSAAVGEALDWAFDRSQPTKDFEKLVEFYGGLRRGDKALCFSFVSHEWWLGEGGNLYHEANLAAAARGARIDRVFAYEHHDELDQLRPVLLAQSAGGIEISVIRLDQMEGLPNYDHGTFNLGGHRCVGFIPKQADGQRWGVTFVRDEKLAGRFTELLDCINDKVLMRAVPLDEKFRASWFR
jgi:transcriptional regulator with XRE-family HTH domain